MANSGGRLTVYLETSLDTRLVLALSSDDTAASLKRKIVAEHLVVFPAMGEITVHAVKTSFRGKMFTLTDSVPVLTLHDTINETVMLYVEALAATHERVLRGERVEEEGLKVPIGGSTIEESMLIEPPRVDKEGLGDLDHDPAGGDASVLRKSEKKRDKERKPSGDVSVRSTEGRKSEDGGFEGNLVQEEPDHMASERESKLNIQANNPVDTNIVNFDVENQSANGDKSKKDESGKGEQLCVEGTDIGITSVERKKRKKNKAAFPEVLTQETPLQEEPDHMASERESKVNTQANNAVDSNTVDCDVENQSANGDKSKKDEYGKGEQLCVEGRDVGVASGERKKRKKNKAVFPEVLTQETPLQEESGHMTSERESKLNIQANKPVDSNIVNFDVENQSANGDGSKKNESGKGEQLHVEGRDVGITSSERKKRKKNKAAFPEVLTQETPFRENGPCKENASNSVVETDKSEIVGAADVINDAALANLTGDAGKEKSRKKSKKTKAYSPDKIPDEVLPIGEENSQKTGNKVHKSHQIVEKQSDSEILQKSAVGETAEAYTSDRQLDKERLEPEISLPAENDIQSHNHNGIQQQADITDGKEELGKDTKIAEETAHVTGGEAGVISLEKKRRKKKKAASIEGLANETTVNESGQEKGTDLIVEKEIVKDAVNAGINKISGTDIGVVSVEKRRRKKTKAAFSGGLSEKPSIEEAESFKGRESNLNVEKEISSRTENAISCPGGDHEVAPKEKRKREKNNVASAGVPHQEQLENGSSKMMLEKEAQLEPDSAHFTENADGVPLSSLKSTDLEDPMHIVSDILADLKKTNPIISDGQIDTAPPIIDNEIGSRETFGTRNQTLFSDNKVKDSVGGGKEKKRRKQEATNSGAEVTIDGEISLSQTDLSVEKEPQTKSQKALEEEDYVPTDISLVDKSLIDKSKEQIINKLSDDASVADETTQNAPSTPEKVQQCGDTEDFHAPVTENIKFMDYFSRKDSDQPTVTISVPVKETTKGNKKTHYSFSKDSPSASVDTRVSSRSKKSGTLKKPVKSSKEHHNPNETSNDVSTKNRKMKGSVAAMAVMSDASTENEEGVVGSQLKRPTGAVRKLTSKAMGDKMDASRKPYASAAVLSSDGVDDNVANNASSAQEESGSVIRGSPMPKKKKGRAMMSPSSSWKDEQLPDDYVPMSQESTRPKKIVNLGSILKGSSSYKKAKLSASQSEDREMIDLVFETQPDHV